MEDAPPAGGVPPAGAYRHAPPGAENHAAAERVVTTTEPTEAAPLPELGGAMLLEALAPTTATV
jgi:hypothetical protein